VRLLPYTGADLRLTEALETDPGVMHELGGPIPMSAVLDAHPDCLSAKSRPSPQWAPDVTVGDVQRWIAQGWYHPALSHGSSAECSSR